MYFVISTVFPPDGTAVPLGGRFMVIGQGNLQISEVAKVDRGSYYCQIVGDPNKRVFSTLTITGVYMQIYRYNIEKLLEKLILIFVRNRYGRSTSNKYSNCC